MSHTDSLTEVRRLRRQSGLNQKEAADELDMPVRTFRAYDRGEREPPASKMDHIRSVLGQDERPVDKDTYNTHTNGSLVKQYPTSDSGTPTVTIDTRLIDTDGDVPDRSEATAHYVQTYMMGVWMKDGWVLARNTSQIEGAGRFVVLWAGGKEKQVIEAMRYDDESVMVTYHHEGRKERFWQVESDGRATIFEREDGSQITVEVLGRVIMPRAHGQQQSEKIQRSVQRALESIQLNGGGNAG